MKRLKKTSGLLLMSLAAASAQASVLVTLDDDGSGNTRFTMSGTFDVSGGSNEGGGGASDAFGVNSFGGYMQWYRFTTDSSSSSSRSFTAGLNSGSPFLAAQFLTTASALTIDDVLISFSPTAAGIIGYDGANTGTLNESGVYTTVPFSSFNTGVWEFGNYGVQNQGLRLEIGQAAVPEPRGMAMVVGLVTVLGAAARRCWV